jgi:hypothetical protein
MTAPETSAGRLVPPPIFLVGSERSGTTLLRLMLDHHPDIAFEKEFDFAVRQLSDTGEAPHVERYVDWLGSLRSVDYAIDPSLGYPELVNDFLRQKQVAAGGKPLVGATIHTNFDRIPYLWPDARYIHLVRDPRDVARSVVQKRWAGNIYQATEFWTKAERCWDALVSQLSADDFIEIHYEDLVLRTQAVLTAICRFIGVDYSSEMLDYRVDAPQYPPPDPALVRQWRTKLSARDVGLVEVRTAGLMRARGYAPSGYPLPEISPVRHWQLLAAARLRSLRTRVDLYGPWLVTTDVLGRRLGMWGLARHAQLRMNAMEQSLIEQESAGLRAPSANIARAQGPQAPDGG